MVQPHEHVVVSGIHHRVDQLSHILSEVSRDRHVIGLRVLSFGYGVEVVCPLFFRQLRNRLSLSKDLLRAVVADVCETTAAAVIAAELLRTHARHVEVVERPIFAHITCKLRAHISEGLARSPSNVDATGSGVRLPEDSRSWAALACRHFVDSCTRFRNLRIGQMHQLDCEESDCKEGHLCEMLALRFGGYTGRDLPGCECFGCFIGRPDETVWLLWQAICLC